LKRRGKAPCLRRSTRGVVEFWTARLVNVHLCDVPKDIQRYKQHYLDAGRRSVDRFGCEKRFRVLRLLPIFYARKLDVRRNSGRFRDILGT